MQKLLNSLLSVLPSQLVFAHCDVPCGIYDPKGAQTAAATVLKMVEKIEALEHPSKEDTAAHNDYYNTLTRCIMTKEEHAKKCKEEILILWTDYFKPVHLEKFPKLHETFWTTAKLCSENKQHISKEAAEKLVKAVDEIADIFQQTKAAK